MIRLESRHDLPFPRAAVWPVLSNTDWLNRAAGLPAVQYEVKALPEGGGSVTARARVFGREIRWREFPFEWLEPEFYRVRRLFETGPFLEGRVGMRLEEPAPGKTRLVVYTELEPRHAFGGWLARRWLGPKAERDMRGVTAHVARFLAGRTAMILPRLPVRPVNEAAFDAGLKKLRASGQPPALTVRLEALVRESPDVELTRLRPFAVARKWGSNSWGVLALFLHATRAGLLDLSWEILCPNCRSSRQPAVSSLSRLQGASHCEVCQIKFDAEFDQSVELKFAVNPAVRPRDTQTFCLAGPGGKPHILSQLHLEPFEERLWRPPDSPQPLRLRSPQVGETLDLRRIESPGEAERRVFSCGPGAFQTRLEPGKHGGREVRFINPNPHPVTVSFERTEWSEDILTAARVTNWQEFRDLFSSEVVSPSEQVTVGSQVVLFTDLSGSTAMYHGLGDASAYAVVRNHFAVLTEAVRAHHGAVVKTIGDAVMATFSRVDEALAAVAQMHRQLPSANPGLATPLALKSSLHTGPCLAVNANEKLDYFGTTINLAARMVECCRGGDLVVSDELFQNPEMPQFLAKIPRPPESLEKRFRGFDQPRRVWRVQMV